MSKQQYSIMFTSETVYHWTGTLADMPKGMRAVVASAAKAEPVDRDSAVYAALEAHAATLEGGADFVALIPGSDVNDSSLTLDEVDELS